MFDWLIKAIRFVFPDYNTRTIRKMQPDLDEINSLEEKFAAMSDEEMGGLTVAFRQRLRNGESLQDIQNEAFAAVREAGKRTLNMRHYDVQILGGLSLHKGDIVEMKTGEGKTLVATLPLYLNALELNPDWVKLADERGIENFEPIFDETDGVLVPPGRGALLVTVNDYLATRDSEWMGKIYKFLGMTVGLNVHDLDADSKRAAYAADITYGTNNEFGFDYLRDNMALRLVDCVQRPEFNYAIVDEVDSILIDEARTPLIISGPAEKATDLYYFFARLAKDTLILDQDYTIDEKTNAVSVNESGIQKVENALGVENLYDNTNMDYVYYLQNCLKAKHFFRRDQEYTLVKREGGRGNEVVIVDSFTGRLMPGRRYSDGLHQAIEAKEGVEIQRENQTLASITFQNYFRLYRKLAGMTGTAETEAAEFKEIYKCNVLVIPPNKPCIRKDMPDVIYRTVKEKFGAIIDQIIEIHQTGQPILVGTVAIDKSETIASMLRKRGYNCQVLNAKYHAMEAEIVAQAGRKGAITVATNMAGRGTDILLGGNPEMLAIKEAGGKDEPGYEEIYNKYVEICAAEKQEVIKAGGLYILGTERHEARRIDNQLRGRAGRQGDPGKSCFYLSLEDDLMRMFPVEAMSNITGAMGWTEGALESSMLTGAIARAQKSAEAHFFSIRKQVLKYDDVLNKQRTVIYAERRKALEKAEIDEEVQTMAEEVLEHTISSMINPELPPEENDYEALAGEVKRIFSIECVGGSYTEAAAKPEEGMLCTMTRDEIYEFLLVKVKTKYEEKRASMGEEAFSKLQKFLLLQIVDSKWKEHLYMIGDLEEGIHLRSWGQQDPLVAYTKESGDLYANMLYSIKHDLIYYLFRLTLSQVHEQEAEEEQKEMYYNRGDDAQTKSMPVEAEDKIGRNDPCPCGSGLKYKRCCGKGS